MLGTCADWPARDGGQNHQTCALLMWFHSWKSHWQTLGVQHVVGHLSFGWFGHYPNKVDKQKPSEATSNPSTTILFAILGYFGIDISCLFQLFLAGWDWNCTSAWLSLWVQLFEMEEVAQVARLRSSLWSSETLVRGMRSVTLQPDGLLVKDEEDETLVREYHVSCSLLGTVCF